MKKAIGNTISKTLGPVVGVSGSSPSVKPGELKVILAPDGCEATESCTEIVANYGYKLLGFPRQVGKREDLFSADALMQMS